MTQRCAEGETLHAAGRGGTSCLLGSKEIPIPRHWSTTERELSLREGKHPIDRPSIIRLSCLPQKVGDLPPEEIECAVQSSDGTMGYWLSGQSKLVGQRASKAVHYPLARGHRRQTSRCMGTPTGRSCGYTAHMRTSFRFPGHNLTMLRETLEPMLQRERSLIAA